MTTIPDQVGREAVRLLNETAGKYAWSWPEHRENINVITVAKLLMNPPAPMPDPDEEAAKRVLKAAMPKTGFNNTEIARAREQMRLERQAWEAGR